MAEVAEVAEGPNQVADDRIVEPPQPHGQNNNNHDSSGLPARPIKGKAARWLPSIAAAGCLGLTYLRARQTLKLKGTAALAFPLFGSHAKERLFAMYMAGNLTSPLLIWTLEELGARGMQGGSQLGQTFNLVTSGFFATALGLQRLGIDRTAPLYFLFLLSPFQDDTSGSDYRRIDPDIARAVLPATLIGHVIPSLLMGALPMTFTEVSRSRFTLQSIVCHAFLYSPFIVPFLTYGIAAARRGFRNKANLRGPVGQRRARHEVDESYTVGGRLHNSVLKEAYSDLFSVQAAGHLLAVASLATQSWSLWGKLSETVPDQLGPLAKAKAVVSWILEPMSFTRFETLSLYVAATTTFGLYTIWELRRRGYTTSREAKRAAAGYIVGNVLVGPGASYAGLWMWREGVLGQLRRGV